MALLELEKLRKDINILFGYVRCLMAESDETSPLVATEWSSNHSTATGNPYTAGTYVFFNGHVYKCKFDNDGIPPTNTTYWLDLGEGHLLAEEQSDWNATGGRRYILNKPTNTSDFVNNGEDGSSPYVTQDEMNSALADPQNLDEVLAEGDSAPTRSANVKEIGLWDNFAAPFGYAKIFATKSRIYLQSKLGNHMFHFSETGWVYLKGVFSFQFNFQTLTNNRTATWQNKSGVIAYLSDIVTLPQRLFAQTGNSVPVTATIAEDTLIGGGAHGGTLTVPAFGFIQGDSFQANLMGKISCVGTATLHIRVKTSGGIMLVDTGIMDLDTCTDKCWKLDLNFTIREVGGPGTASIASGGLFSYVRNSGTNFEGVCFNFVNETTFDTTINNELEVTAQWNTTNATNSIYSQIFTLNKIF